MSMPKYLVETISMFRMRYVIECESAEHAKVTVAMEEADEFGQHHVGESIIGCREVTDEEIPVLFFEDAPYLESWGAERALQQVHVVNHNTDK